MSSGFCFPPIKQMQTTSLWLPSKSDMNGPANEPTPFWDFFCWLVPHISLRNQAKRSSASNTPTSAWAFQRWPTRSPLAQLPAMRHPHIPAAGGYQISSLRSSNLGLVETAGNEIQSGTPWCTGRTVCHHFEGVGLTLGKGQPWRASNRRRNEWV